MRSIAILVMLFGIGCSKGDGLPQPVDVSGKIQLKGKPASGATVGFAALTSGLPAKYRYQQGVTSEDGSYRLAGVYPGEYLVCVTFPSESTTAATGNPETPISGTKAPPYSRMTDDNPLRAMVSTSATQFDFDLKP